MPSWAEAPMISPRPRKLRVWNENWPKNPSKPEYPAPNWISLREVSWPLIVMSTFRSCWLTANCGSSVILKYPSWVIFVTLFLTASMSMTSPSSRANSLRMTLSRVWVFPCTSSRPR